MVMNPPYLKEVTVSVLPSDTDQARRINMTNKAIGEALLAFNVAESKGRVFNVFEQNHIKDLRSLKKILEGKE